MSRAPTISVIMPAFNAAHYMEVSLPPLIRLRDRGEVSEVIVVDDCSTNPSNIETARRLGASIMSTAANGGPGAARNIAAKSAVGELIWFVDADVVAHETGPEKIRNTFKDPTVTAVFGSYDDKPPAENFASQYKNLVHRYYHQRGSADASTFWAGCGAIRRSSFLAIGGFDQRNYQRPAIEDIELGHRLREAGERIRLIHDLLGTHLKNWRLAEVIRTDIFQRAIPWSRLILSSPRKNNDLNLSYMEKVRAVIALTWAASLIALPAAFFDPLFGIAFSVMTGVMLIANWSLLGYFTARHGPLFAAAGLVFHQIYYLYSTASYAYCVGERALKKPVRAPESVAQKASSSTRLPE